AAELVHAAEADLRILDGRNGFVLYRDVNGSNTVSDSVVVADVDADGEAEIVSVTDGKQPLGPDPGVRVYGEGQGLWPDARRIWNQYQYSVTNVNDDGTIPRREHRDLALGHRWAVAGSVADDGVFTPSCAFPQPDLTASAFNMTDDGVQRRLTVRIGNGGARVVGPGVPVSFYDDDPRIDPVRLSTVETTTHLRPGQYEIVEIALPVSLRTRGPVFVSADDFGHLRGRILESDEDNNIYDTGMALLATAALPDLSVADVDISGLAGDWQTLAVSGRGAAVVQNLSPTPVQGPFEVSFFEDRDGDGAFGEADTLLGRAVVDGLGAHTTTVVEAPLSGSLLFRGSIIRTHADSGGVVPEVDEANNVGRAGESCRVQPPGPPWSLREEWAWANAGVVSSPAVGDLDGDGVSDVVFVAMRGGETADGQLSAVTGRNGTVLFSVSDRTLDLNPAGSVALGDIDGDGHTEIVAIGEAGNVLLAFEADGTFKWRSAPLAQNVGAGAPFLADLDGDGQSEIVIGKQVLRGSDG
ncbi:MAG: VCBS repeat-containing protein, partial [Candidatus Aminicenantes bacterium]|nr:VCBS repeat-containing protein [Candidatus Aminicenantes bacterium]